MHLYQMYIDQERKSKSCNELIDLSSRKNPTAIAHLVLDFKEIEANEIVFQLNTHWNWTIHLNDLWDDFRTCFDFRQDYLNHSTYYENNILSITTKCGFHDINLDESCTVKNDNNITLVEIESSKNMTDMNREKIELFLKCTLSHKEIDGAINGAAEYRFLQIVELDNGINNDLNSTSKTPIPNASTSMPIKPASTSMIVTIVTVITILFLTASVILYYKRKTSYNNIGGEWAENPNYSESNSFIEENEDQILPNWLLERNEMIYDTNCIEKGRQLGHGNYGAVFEGKIRLGNAVYIFYLCLALLLQTALNQVSLNIAKIQNI